MLANDKRRIGRVLLLALLLPAIRTTAAEPDYRDLALHAGIIFRGTVVAIERVPPAAPGEIPILRVTFRVHEAVRGAAAGQLLTVCQWDGDFAGEGYRLGETLTLFLHPPSGELGLTSTVGGQPGRVPAENSATALAAVRAAEATADAEPRVEPEPDLPPSKRRWRLRHPAGTRGSIPQRDRLPEID